MITVDVDGIRYLVSTRGESQWVRNVRANPTVTLATKMGTARFTATEVPVPQRDPVLTAYRAKGRQDGRRLLRQTAGPGRPPGVQPDAGVSATTSWSPGNPLRPGRGSADAARPVTAAAASVQPRRSSRRRRRVAPPPRHRPAPRSPSRRVSARSHRPSRRSGRPSPASTPHRARARPPSRPGRPAPRAARPRRCGPLAPGQPVAQPQPHQRRARQARRSACRRRTMHPVRPGRCGFGRRQAAGRHHPAHRSGSPGHPFGVQRDHHNAATIVLAASAITQATTNM